jgi:hypothetical protein
MNLYDWFMNTKEVQGLGFNLLTLTSLCLLSLALFNAWGAWKQTKQVWGKQSAKGLDSQFVCFSTAFYIYNVFYGYAISGFTIVVAGGSRGLVFLPLLLGVGKFGKVSRTDLLVGAGCFLALVALVISPWLAEGFLAFAIVSVLFLVRAPLALYRLPLSQGVGDVSGTYVATLYSLFTFWLLYSIALGDGILIFLSILYFSVWTCMVGLWLKRNRLRVREEQK